MCPGTEPRAGLGLPARHGRGRVSVCPARAGELLSPSCAPSPRGAEAGMAFPGLFQGPALRLRRQTLGCSAEAVERFTAAFVFMCGLCHLVLGPRKKAPAWVGGNDFLLCEVAGRCREAAAGEGGWTVSEMVSELLLGWCPRCCGADRGAAGRRAGMAEPRFGIYLPERSGAGWLTSSLASPNKRR